MPSKEPEGDLSAWPECILSERTRITVTSLHTFPRRGGSTFTKASHSPDHVLGAVTDRSCHLTVNGTEEESLAEGSIFWFLPGSEVDLAFEKGHSPYVYWVQFNLYPRTAQFHARPGEPAPAIHIIESKPLCELLAQFAKMPFCESDPNHLKALFYLIASEPAAKSIAQTSARDRLSSREVRHLFDWIRTHMVPWPTPHDLAQQVGLSPKYFSLKFKNTLNMAPRTWILRERMRTSAQFLRETRLPIREIAARMGYEDAYRFSHQFRRVFATSPRQYREQQVKNPPSSTE